MKKILLCSLVAITLLFAQNSVENSDILNSPIKGVLVNGYEFSSENSCNGNSLLFSDENNCKYLGNATYSLFKGKAYVSLFKRSCISNGKVVDSNIKGFVTEDQKGGLSTQTIYSSDSVIARLNPNKNVELIITKIDSNLK